jgi:hypothetical protein
MNAKPKRLGLWIPWALFAAVILAWCGYWFAARSEAIRQINAAIEQERANGADIGVGAMTASGFPLRLSVRLSDAHYAPADRAWRLNSERIALNINLSNPSHLLIAPEAALQWTKTGGETLTIAPRAANMSVRFVQEDLARLSLLATDVTITDSRGPAKSATLARFLMHARPDVRDDKALQIALEADDWVWGAAPAGFEGFGPRLQQVRAALSVEQRALLGQGQKKDPLSAWSEKGARMQVETLQAQWGEVSVTGKGALGLDPARRPVGQIGFDFADAATTIDAVAQSSLAPSDARAGLRLLGAGLALTGGKIEAPLEVKDGWWRLGPAPLWPAAPIYRM